MSKLGILHDARYKQHITEEDHPERPVRLDAIKAAIDALDLPEPYTPIEPVLMTEQQLQRVHSASYLTHVESACRQGWPNIDSPDCPISPESWDIARLAAGGTVKAARLVAEGELRRAFCAVRPPGHHAETDRAAGFCLFNNIALAARTLQDAYGYERILILDFDVHHGNGTQHTFEHDPSVLYISLHGHPLYLYPHTGYEDETGEGPGRGYTVNIPLMPGTDDDAYRAAFRGRIIPEIERYAPQFFLISTGFDAHIDDPLGNLNLTDETFAWISETLVQLADRLARGRLVSVLEGGYNLAVLERCVGEHLRILGK
ncbi:MAG: histone deacetylase [Phycisphaerae bacterium]|nr:histone deacetylase [Phycisphaerae bacterium]